MSYCATCDGNFFRDKEVMVVGGGNTAAGDAIYLSRICKKVYLVHRRDKLRATAIYHKRLEDLPNLEFVWNAVPRKLVADEGKLAGVRLEMLETGEERDIAVDGLFVAVGTEPNTEFLGDRGARRVRRGRRAHEVPAPGGDRGIRRRRLRRRGRRVSGDLG